MKRSDDRTEDQRRTHTVLIVGTDSFLSGWGEARNGVSYAAWACQPKDADRVERWVRSRSDMKRVRVTGDPYYPKGTGHLQIYVVDEKHNSLA